MKFGLNDDLLKRFMEIQEKHFNAWSSEERKEQHSLENIEKVKYNPSEDIFYVYYKETDRFRKEWYHYDDKKSAWW